MLSGYALYRRYRHRLLTRLARRYLQWRLKGVDNIAYYVTSDYSKITSRNKTAEWTPERRREAYETL